MSCTRPIERIANACGGANWKSPQEQECDVTCPIHGGGHESHPSLNLKEVADGDVLAFCQVCGPAVKLPQFVVGAGLTMADTFRELLAKKREAEKKSSKGDGPKGEPTGHWDYFDREGVLLYRAVRLEPGPEGRSKEFRPKRPDGQGGWRWGIKGVKRVLYGLSGLLKSDQSKLVLIPEGEAKVDALVKLGYIAVCNLGGAKKWKKEYCGDLKGRHVVILPDNDQPGSEHAVQVREHLDGIAASVRIVNLPVGPKSDIIDWLAAGGTQEQLQALLDAPGAADPGPAEAPMTSEAPPTAATDPASVHFEIELLAALNLDVLGEIADSNGAVKVFSADNRKSEIIRDVSRLSYARLLQICGPVVKAAITPRSMSHAATNSRCGRYKTQSACWPGQRKRINDDTEAGVGTWEGLSDAGIPDDSIILVGSGNALRWNAAGPVETIIRPRIGGRLIDIGGSGAVV